MKTFSIIILPLFVLFIIIYGYIKKVELYDSFIRGAKEGLIMTFNLAPFIVGMVFAINLFINTNIIDFLINSALPFFNKINVPTSILPIAILRPISGSATLVILNNVLEQFGPDSYVGRLASVVQGSTDTTFYVMTLYFASIHIKKIRHTLKVGLIRDLIGIIASIIIVYLMFG